MKLLIKKSILKSALKVVLVGAGVSGGVVAAVQSTQNAQLQQPEWKTATIYQPADGNEAANPIKTASHSAVYRTATVSSGSSMPQVTTAQSYSPVKVGRASSSGLLNMTGVSGATSYASNATSTSRTTAQAASVGGGSGSSMSFSSFRRGSLSSVGSTTVSSQIAIEEPFSESNSHIHTRVSGGGGGWTDPDIPEEQNVPLDGVGALLACLAAYAGAKMGRKVKNKE